MDWKNMGKPGTALAIFIPGTFVFLNFVLSFHYTFDEFFSQFSFIKENQVVTSLISFCFGYLIGIGLRLLKTELADQLSGLYLRKINRKFRKKKHHFLLEKFPYMGWLGGICQEDFPESALEFFNEFWLPRKDSQANRNFFNLVKTLFLKIDKDMAAHFYALESEIRSISGMIYGLIVSLLILLVPIFKILVKTVTIESFLVFLFVLYCTALYFLLKNFRYMRMKEVNEVFSGTLAYKKELNDILYP